MAPSRLTLADWSKRSTNFGLLRADGRRVAMELRPANPYTSAWRALCIRWLGFPDHPNLLEALDLEPDGTLLVRYAALAWPFPPLRLMAFDLACSTLAAWGTQIIDVFCMLVSDIADLYVEQLLEPFVEIDIGGGARVGFLPVATSKFEHAETDLVHVIGELMDGLSDGMGRSATRAVIDRCLAEKPAKRYQTVQELQSAWLSAHEDSDLSEDPLHAWELFEEGVGWLQLGDKRTALARFEAARALDPEGRTVPEIWSAIEAVAPVPGRRSPTTRAS